MNYDTSVVIAAHSRRLDELKSCLRSFNHDVSPEFNVVVVTNEPNPIRYADLVDEFDEDYLHIINTQTDEINLAKWFNLGFSMAKENGATEVLWLETDVSISKKSILDLRVLLHSGEFSMLGPNLWGELPVHEIDIRKTHESGLRHSQKRICQVSMISTDTPYLMDENLKWWYEIDDFELRNREHKQGTAVVGWIPAKHPPINSTNPTGLLLEHTEKGRAYFHEKWNRII